MSWVWQPLPAVVGVPPAIIGVADIAEANDTLLATGELLVKGALAATEGNDTLDATGTVLIQGVLAVTEDDDTLVASGFLSASTGLLNVTEADDTLTATGILAITGVLNVTEDDDTLGGGSQLVNLGGGKRPYYDVAVVGWGAIRAYPQVIFDFVLETPPRGIPVPVEKPVIVPVSKSEQEKLAKFAEAAAAFDLELVRKYLKAVGIDLNG